VTVIIPYPAGNAIDVLGRLMLESMGRRLGPRFVIDNRSGAAGNLGTSAAARATPDGYTLLISASGPLAVNVSLLNNLPYDPMKDFEPIGLFASTPNVLVVHNGLNVSSVAEFIKLAETRPGTINYGSVGNGSSQHVAAALFELITGVKLTHVPFRAAGDLVTGLIRGDIQASFQLIPNIQSQLEAGQMRALGVASARRLSAYPHIPTMAEAGVANYEAAAWFGMLAPKRTPKPIIERLSTTVDAVMAGETLRKRFDELGAEPVSITNAAFGSFIQSEIAKWRNVITRAGIKA
jgi:tripartite-type tricarboxylate transporter receptor subunit TctC